MKDQNLTKKTTLLLLIILTSLLSCTNQSKDQKKDPTTQLKEISNNPNFKIIRTTGNFDCEIQDLTNEEIEAANKKAPSQEGKDLKVNEDNGNEITMLVVYTTEAKNELTNSDSLINAVRRAENKTNLVFENNGIDLKVSVIAIKEAPDFNEVSMKDDLGSMYSEDKGKKIREWRDSLYADVVCLVRSTGGGRAVMLTSDNEETHSKYAYMTIGSACIDESYFCFCHELGHLLGCGHEIEKNSQGRYDYSYGWHFDLPNDSPDLGKIGTMMSYIGAESRLLSFSDPNLGYEGVAIGSEKANNAATINNTKKKVANYRVKGHGVQTFLSKTY